MTDEEQKEFSEYIANRFIGIRPRPVGDDGYLKPWEAILTHAKTSGAADAINAMVCPARPTEFREPEKIRISIIDSFVGKIPVIIVQDVIDFENLVTNIACKGVRPPHMERTGASFIHGKSTRFMILSSKPYSNVIAQDLGLKPLDWVTGSLKLRFAHECTHYYTKLTYGIAGNTLHDEIMADFTGIHEAFGFYRASWFLRFMGLLGDNGGRLIYYIENLSENVRAEVSTLLKNAAYGLERWSKTKEFAALSTGARIKFMCKIGLNGMSELAVKE